MIPSSNSLMLLHAEQQAIVRSAAGSSNRCAFRLYFLPIEDREQPSRAVAPTLVAIFLDAPVLIPILTGLN
jgi:hypothetical protein